MVELKVCVRPCLRRRSLSRSPPCSPRVQHAADAKRHCVLEMPTGTGKTVALLVRGACRRCVCAQAATLPCVCACVCVRAWPSRLGVCACVCGRVCVGIV